MPCLNAFCNSELSTGVRVAATFSLVLSCPMLAVGCWYFKSMDIMREMNWNMHYYDDYINFDYYTLMGATYLIFGMSFSLSAGILFLSITKKNRLYSFPWLFTAGFAVAYYTIILILYGFIGGEIAMGEQIIIFPVILAMSYFFIVVFSFAQVIYNQSLTGSNQVASIDAKIPQNSVQTQIYPSLPVVDARHFPPPQPLNPLKTQPLLNIQQPINFLPPIHFPPTQPNNNLQVQAQGYAAPPPCPISNTQLVTTATNPAFSAYPLNPMSDPAPNYFSQPPDNSNNIATPQYTTYPNPSAPDRPFMTFGQQTLQ